MVDRLLLLLVKMMMMMVVMMMEIEMYVLRAALINNSATRPLMLKVLHVVMIIANNTGRVKMVIKLMVLMLLLLLTVFHVWRKFLGALC